MDLAILEKLNADIFLGYLIFNGRRINKGQMEISLTCKLLKKWQQYDVNRNIYFSSTKAALILTCFGENWKYQVFMSEPM